MGIVCSMCVVYVYVWVVWKLCVCMLCIYVCMLYVYYVCCVCMCEYDVIYMCRCASVFSCTQLILLLLIQIPSLLIQPSDKTYL